MCVCVCVYTSLTDFEYGRALCVRGASLWHRFSNRDSYNCTGTKPIETVALSKQSLIDRFLFCLLLVLYVYLSREYNPRHVINLRSQLVCVCHSVRVTRKRERERSQPPYISWFSLPTLRRYFGFKFLEMTLVRFMVLWVRSWPKMTRARLVLPNDLLDKNTAMLPFSSIDRN